MSIDGVERSNALAARDDDAASMGPSMSIDGVSVPAPAPATVISELQWGRR